MRIELEKIKDAPFLWEEDLAISLTEIDRPELEAITPPHLEGRLSPLEQGFVLQGKLDYRQTLTCSRCLERFEEPIAERLDLMVVEGAPPDTSGEHLLQSEDLGVVYVEGGHLATEPLVFEQIQINVPMKPLCRPDCPGLAVAGEAAAVDPRWAGLAALKGGSS
jgi:uncharacterized protein